MKNERSATRAIQDIFGVNLEQADRVTLRNVFREAINLSRIIRMHSSEYIFNLPRKSAPVDEDSMSDRFGDEFADVANMHVKLALFPALVKSSSVSGKLVCVDGDSS